MSFNDKHKRRPFNQSTEPWGGREHYPTTSSEEPGSTNYKGASQPTDYTRNNSEPLGPGDRPPDRSYPVHIPNPDGSITTKYRVPATPEEKRIQDGLFQGGVLRTPNMPYQTEPGTETVQQKHEPTDSRKTGGRQKNLFILFLVLGISSIAALQNIEPATSINTTGYFLTSVSLASTNVIFVLFVFITGFILGRHHN